MEITQVECWRLHRLNVGDYTVFTMGNPLRDSRLYIFWGRLHRLNVGDYTLFHYGKSLKRFEIKQILWEIRRLEYWI
jgi:hypothetical protein